MPHYHPDPDVQPAPFRGIETLGQNTEYSALYLIIVYRVLPYFDNHVACPNFYEYCITELLSVKITSIGRITKAAVTEDY